MAKQNGKSGPTYDNIPDLTAWLRGTWEGACPDESPNGEVLADWLAPFNRGEKRLRGMKPRGLRDAIAKAEFYSWYAEQGMIEPAHWGLEATLHDLKVLLQREKEASIPAITIDDVPEKTNEPLDEEDRFAELYKHLDERQLRGVKECDPLGACNIASELKDPLRQLERARATLYLVALTEGLEDDVHDALIFLSNTLGETVEDVDTKVGEIGHKLWAIGQGYYDVVPAKRRGPDRPMSDDQIERLQSFLNEERRHASKIRGDQRADGALVA